MAVLTPEDLKNARALVSGQGLTSNFTKSVTDAATQAIEDWFISNQASLVSAINAATAPLVLNPTQKKAFVLGWLLVKLGRGGN